MKTITSCHFLLVSLLGRAIAQQCTGDYNSCCPALDTKQISISGKEHIVHCKKNVAPISQGAVTPKACADLCLASKDCLQSYWEEPGACFMSRLEAPPSTQKENTLALIPVLSVLPPVDNTAACKKNITLAVDARRNADIIECTANSTLAVNAAKGAKDKECEKLVNAANEAKTKECVTNLNNVRAEKAKECEKNLNFEKEECKKRINAHVPAYTSTPPEVCGPGRRESRHGRHWQVWNDCTVQGPRFGAPGGHDLDSCLKRCLGQNGCYLAITWKKGALGGSRDGKCVTYPTKKRFEELMPFSYETAHGKPIFGPWPFRSQKLTEAITETWVLL